MNNTKAKFPENMEDMKKFVNFIVMSRTAHPIVSFACSEVGIDFEELLPKRLEELEDKSASKEVNELRFSHLEARRKAKVNIVCEFLIENKHSKATASSKKIAPQNNSESTSVCQEHPTDRMARVLKSKIVHQMIVEENLKRIKEEQEAEKKHTELKIHEKELREAKKVRNTKNFEIRDKRIKERLMKKQKDVEEHEQKALKMTQTVTMQLKVQSSSYTPPHRYVESANDAEIQEKLENIHKKLDRSAARAKQLLLEKVPHSVSSQLARVKTVRDQLLHKQQEETTQKLVKIQQDIEFSNVRNTQRRRAEIINEQKRLSKSVNIACQKKIKDENSWYEKVVKEGEEKDVLIEKVRKEVKELNEQKSCFVGMKMKLRKKDQEENLKRMQLQKGKDRRKWLEKIKESAAMAKQIDMNSIRALAEKEVKDRLGLKDNNK